MFMLERWDRLLFELCKTKAVALTFTSAMPPGLGREPIPQGPGCTFLKLAAEGRAFYVETNDHFRHGGAEMVGLKSPDLRAEELSELIALTVNLLYKARNEVATFSGPKAPFRYVIYAPLGLSPTFPDLVLVHGKRRELMWLGEAMRAAGVFPGAPVWGRQACSMAPRATAASDWALMAEGVGDHNLNGSWAEGGRLTIPGRALGVICDELASLLAVNKLLANLRRQRKQEFGRDGLTSAAAFLMGLRAIDMRSSN